jgi:hypothetical protein
MDVPTFKIEIVKTVILDIAKILRLKDPQLFGDWICPRLQVERESGEYIVMVPSQRDSLHHKKKKKFRPSVYVCVFVYISRHVG